MPLTCHFRDSAWRTMRGLYVAIVALLSFALVVYGIKCRYCVQEEPRKGCLNGASECYPQRGRTCISINFYYKGVMEYRMEGCAFRLSDCWRKITNRRTGFKMNVTCCASRDFCNHWEHEESD